MKKLFAVFIALFLFVPLFAYDYYFSDYTVNVSVGKNAVHEIDEQYSVNFQNPRHGLYRYVPYDYSRSGALNAVLSNVMCSDQCSVFKEDGFYVFKIGSSDRMIQGPKKYRLAYSYDLGSDLNKGYDEFYLNLLGSSWEVPFENVHFSVFVPEKYEKTKVWVTRGLYGSSSQVDYVIEQVENGFYIIGNQSNFSEYEALTLRVQFEDSWYENARTIWDYRQTAKALNPVISILILAIAAVLWIFKGRDNVPIISAKFNPPQNFTPLEVGFIADESVDDKDITSMLYYWADKGLITINEKKKNKYSFTKIFNIDDSASDFEKELFNAFFKNADASHSVTFDNLEPNSFITAVQRVKAKVARNFRNEKSLYDKSSKVFQSLIMILSVVPFCSLGCALFLSEIYFEEIMLCVVPGVFCIVFSSVLFGILFQRWYVRKTNFPVALLCILPSVAYVFFTTLFVGSMQDFIQVLVSVICSSLTVLFAVITKKRSAYGDKVLEDVLGYREFIEKVSMSQLVMMIEKDPEYYYHVLCYAIVLGLADKWAKKFENIPLAAPSWYIGNYAVNSMYFYHMSSRMLTSVRTHIVPPQAAKNVKIGGSGFNMSGFAGGGFGGGGGRAW